MLTILSSSNLIYAAATYAALLLAGAIGKSTQYQMARVYCQSRLGQRW